MPKTPPSDPSAETEAAAAEVVVGKGHATPTRKEREAARKRPLVPEDRKAAAKASRAKLNEQRERARIGMANGEERFMPMRDRGPQKRYVRDYVDARWNMGEVLLPLMVLVILTYFVPIAEVAIYALTAVWGVIVLVAIDCVLLTIRLRKKLVAKFGDNRVEKVGWYTTMRSVQMRPLRMPKPQVKRGEFPS